MNDDAIFLTNRVDCIAGKPPPTEVALFHNLMMCLMSQASIRTASPATGPRHESCHANPAGRCSPG
ncbi:hypothetical protein EZZ81_18395 [Pseudomonas viridiflava]|uniref:Uncharacterized protein n=1 Tax=Pseudomonas viridiflava TaxID=33069 RepID=A0AA46ZWY1_PSEVI|nr:hypothetical protein EZZ81_18395 [Pseudomonas viridiflava]